MSMRSMLTTTEAAALAAVAPSTLKRWADRELLPFARTAGGHRRFERAAVERFVREQSGSEAAHAPLVEGWIATLTRGLRHEVDARLLEARFRLGAWYRVTDELGSVLEAMGREWVCGRLSIAQEHAASECLARALARMGDALPSRVDAPRCLLACAGDDEHTLGLSLLELCLRELGWASVWLGRRTPLEAIVASIEHGDVVMVALSASEASSNTTALAELVARVGDSCARQGVDLLLGGNGAWPSKPQHGVRLTSFAGVHARLAAGR
jgi:MerR family transcriptional regulator, light-induced transcriptional regulator